MSTLTLPHARIKRIGVGKISKTFAFEILNEDLSQENLQALEQLYRDGETCALGVIVLEDAEHTTSHSPIIGDEMNNPPME